MPRALEGYKLKLAVEREGKWKPGRTLAKKRVSSVEGMQLEDRRSYSIRSPPCVRVKSPVNANSLFEEIMQDRLNDFDHRMAREIIASAKRNESKRIRVSNAFEVLSRSYGAGNVRFCIVVEVEVD